MKFDDTPSREEREDFWLDLGPASAYEGLDCCETCLLYTSDAADE